MTLLGNRERIRRDKDGFWNYEVADPEVENWATYYTTSSFPKAVAQFVGKEREVIIER